MLSHIRVTDITIAVLHSVSHTTMAEITTLITALTTDGFIQVLAIIIITMIVILIARDVHHAILLIDLTEVWTVHGIKIIGIAIKMT